jgi:hypothetical protein
MQTTINGVNVNSSEVTTQNTLHINLITQAVLNKARQDKFTLIINIPPIMQKIKSNEFKSNKLANLDALQYSLYNCPVPKISSPRINLPFKGQTPHVSSYSREQYPQVNVNFTVDNDYQNYWFIWKWLQMIHHATDGVYSAGRIGGVDDPKNKFQYAANFHLFARDEYHTPKIRFDYYDCFVVSLGEINYNQRETEEINCSFEFSFNQLDIVLLNTDDAAEKNLQNSSRLIK